MKSENFKIRVREIPFIVEVLGLGIFVYLFSEVLIPLVFRAKEETANHVVIFATYMLGSFISIVLIRLYKKMNKS